MASLAKLSGGNLMNRKVSNLCELDLEDVQDRVYAKYDVTRSDARLAVEYLRCFFDAKRVQPNELIILPQIADWAWHELILDTVRYRTVCSQVFGIFLHHIATTVDFDELLHDADVDAQDLTELDPRKALARAGLESSNLRDDFLKSLAMMRDVYGLGLGTQPDQWLEAGWDTPTYRLRKPILVPKQSHNGDTRTSNTNDLEGSRQLRFLSWLPGRIARRFGIPFDAARRGVREYSELFLHLRSSRTSNGLDGCSILCEIAWEEHILWTQRYAEDCYRVLGFFLEHVPRVDVPTLENLAAVKAA